MAALPMTGSTRAAFSAAKVYSMITLYQFQFSHFCEKARWALDYKGVPYLRGRSHHRDQ